MPLKVLMQLMAMMLTLVRTLLADKANLAIENLALRQPLDRLGPGKSSFSSARLPGLGSPIPTALSGPV